MKLTKTELREIMILIEQEILYYEKEYMGSRKEENILQLREINGKIIDELVKREMKELKKNENLRKEVKP